MLRCIKYGLNGAVVAGLIAAPVVWSSVDRSVRLEIDGQQSTFRTTAGSVGEALAERGMAAGDHDLLAPAASSKLEDGMQIVLRRGRLLHLSVDGRSTQVWTTSRTVDGALAALGYSTHAYVSVSRARRLPLRPTDIAIRTPRRVTVVHDGTTESVTTTAPTVGRMLAEINVVPGPSDRLSVPTSTDTVQGQVVSLLRVGRKSATRTESLAFRTSRRTDAKLAKGVTRVVEPGRVGTAKVTYSVVYVDGVATTRAKVSAVTVAKPRTRVVAVGTKRPVVDKPKTKIRSRSTAAPKRSSSTRRRSATVPSAPVPGPGSAKAIARGLVADYGWGERQYDCLVQLWNHESGWRVTAANPSGAYGIPQALPGSKMASAGPNWQTNATTQITWGLGYIKARYNNPCGALGFWQAHNYY